MSGEKTMIYFIRHAEKSLTGEQALTERGFHDAYNYGKFLSQQGLRFDEVVSSPVKRCMQTAKKIIEGLHADIVIQKSHLLGAPGIFVQNDKQAAQVFDRFSVHEVINLIIQGKILPGFFPFRDACKPLINEIQTKLSLRKSVLYISHDAVIMPFIAHIKGSKRIELSEIVNYLNGYTLNVIRCRKETRLFVAGEARR
ncbi:MAG: histidine phosphatase family protein [bacterium]|nr:histidine phosphatase family protein [bacterium]